MQGGFYLGSVLNMSGNMATSINLGSLIHGYQFCVITYLTAILVDEVI